MNERAGGGRERRRRVLEREGGWGKGVGRRGGDIMQGILKGEKRRGIERRRSHGNITKARSN